MNLDCLLLLLLLSLVFFVVVLDVDDVVLMILKVNLSLLAMLFEFGWVEWSWVGVVSDAQPQFLVKPNSAELN